MAHTSKIEWTEATWNPWHGCHKVSAGCKNCYMFRDKAKYGQDPNVVVRSKTRFYDPLKWSEPRTIFTCSWSDFFIEEADPWRDEAFAIMALTPQHTYQVLTKRPERMLEYSNNFNTEARIMDATARLLMNDTDKFAGLKACILQQVEEWFPLPNVWLGVSVEDQKTADERIPILLDTPAALRWLSLEPLLGPVDLKRLRETSFSAGTNCLTGSRHIGYQSVSTARIDWAVVGGESGPAARPMHPDWARDLRDQCTAAGVPFFFKQWGEWVNFEDGYAAYRAKENCEVHSWPNGRCSYRVGRQAAGRELDGRTWDEMPVV
jgi:protein gp37